MEINHQGVLADHDKEWSLLSFNVTKNGVVNDLLFIEKIVLFMELVGKVKPKYVLFDKSEVDFEITPRLFKFAELNVISEIMGYGVKLIFFCVTPNRYQAYKADTNKPLFVIPCLHYQQVLDAIAADRAPAR